MKLSKPMIPAIGGAVLCCLFAVLALVALLRFGFSTGHVWLHDLQKFLFTVLVPVSVLAAYLGNAHVRAGLADLHQKKNLRRVEHALLVAVPALLLLIVMLPVLLLSWSQLEASGEIDGLPGYFLAKSVLALCLAVMVVLAVYRSVGRRGQD